MEKDMSEKWQSPRKVEEDLIMYQRNRFEWYMELVESGVMPLDNAMEELRKELSVEDL